MNDLLLEEMDKAINIINRSQRIFIASHVNPDGDNIGSSLALALALKNINKEVIVLSTEDTPNDFLFLPGADLYQEYDESLGETDLFITLDSSDIERLGRNIDLLSKAKYVINLDHHISNTNYGHVNIVDPKLASTGELVYYLLKRMELNIDRDIATNIYTAISTDSGKFSYESVSSNTHRIVADLIDCGIDVKDINIKLYESTSIESTNLFIKTLSTLKTYANNAIAIVSISQKILEETNTTLNDAEGIASFIRGIGPVEVSCLLKEVEINEIKVSLRSKEYVDVAAICKTFDGGGHIRAAGCTIHSDLATAQSTIVNEILKNIR